MSYFAQFFSFVFHYLLLVTFACVLCCLYCTTLFFICGLSHYGISYTGGFTKSYCIQSVVMKKFNNL